VRRFNNGCDDAYEMDGMEACENIRKNPELRNVIIAFLAAEVKIIASGRI
jgi:CheY-like chemotaxis protein